MAIYVTDKSPDPDVVIWLRNIRASVAETGDKVTIVEEHKHLSLPLLSTLVFHSKNGGEWAFPIPRVEAFLDQEVKGNLARAIQGCLRKSSDHQKLISWLNGGMIQLELPYT
jgi:hypothetical protein